MAQQPLGATKGDLFVERARFPRQVVVSGEMDHRSDTISIGDADAFECPLDAVFGGEIDALIHGEANWEIREVPKALAKTGSWIEDEILDEDPFVKPWMIDFADDHYALDVTRARALLGWNPKHSLREALPRIIESLKADPQAWYRSNKLNPSLVAADALAQSTAKADEPLAMAHEHDAMQDHETMIAADNRWTRWAHFANIGLGAWLMTSPIVFGTFGGANFSEAVLRVTAERGLSALEWRSAMLAWSDLASGFLLIAFGGLSLMPRFSWRNGPTLSSASGCCSRRSCFGLRAPPCMPMTPSSGRLPSPSPSLCR
jgi:hypothetical protein